MGDFYDKFVGKERSLRIKEQSETKSRERIEKVKIREEVLVQTYNTLKSIARQIDKQAEIINKIILVENLNKKMSDETLKLR